MTYMSHVTYIWYIYVHTYVYTLIHMCTYTYMYVCVHVCTSAPCVFFEVPEGNSKKFRPHTHTHIIQWRHSYHPDTCRIKPFSSPCLWVCVCACVCPACECCVCVHVCEEVVPVCACVRVSVCVCTWRYIYIYIYTHIYVYVYVYMYTYIYTYICTYTWRSWRYNSEKSVPSDFESNDVFRIFVCVCGGRERESARESERERKKYILKITHPTHKQAADLGKFGCPYSRDFSCIDCTCLLHVCVTSYANVHTHVQACA
jgi:hypothetical protein